MNLGSWGFKSPLAHFHIPFKDTYLEATLKVDVETLGPTKKRLHVEIPAEDVNQELQKLYKSLRKEAKIPGFRPGRVPIRLLKARFKEHIRQEVIQSLVPQAYKDIFNEEGITPLSSPNIETDLTEVAIEEDQPFAFTCTVDVRPEIVLPDYSEIEIDKQIVDIPRDVVDEAIERLREERAQYPPIEEDRPTQIGDFVTVDWEVTEGDTVLNTETDVHVKLEEGSLLPEVQQALIGVAVGTEKDVPVTFPEDHGNPSLAGKNAILHITVKEITTRQLPELDDAFAAEFGFETYEQFVGNTWNQLIEVGKASQYQQQVTDILDQLREKVEIEIPEFFLAEQIKEIQERYRRTYQREGRDLQEIQTEAFQQSLHEEASTAIRNGWLLAEIADRENITVEDWEIEQEIRRLALQRDQDTDTYRKMLETTNRLDEIEDSIFRTKVFDFLIENVSAKEQIIIAG